MGFMSFTGILGVLHVRECDKPNGSCHDFIKLPSQMYIITVKRAGLEFQYTQGHFKIPIISTYAKVLFISCC